MYELLIDPESATGPLGDGSADTNAPLRIPVVPDEFDAGSEGLRVIYGQLRSLYIPGAEGEDESRPTPVALRFVYEILEQTAYAMMKQCAGETSEVWRFPRGYVSTDDHGGIRIEWWHKRTHCVILVVAHDLEAALTYVFTKSGAGQEGRMDRRVFPALLASWLHALNELNS